MTERTDTADDAAIEDEGPSEVAPETAYGCLVTESRGQRVLHVERDAWFDTALALLDDGFRMCIDVTAVDYLTHGGRRDLPAGVAPERFEVVAMLLHHGRRERIRLRTQVPADDPTIATLTQLYPGADYAEREAYDMFGIVFDGHPDLSRILMPENWDGHPLRKDYAVGSIPVQFKGTN
ncbi:MAG: NADH-quinone oxidoreductase subunit C [Acidimicrobiales bacterium]